MEYSFIVQDADVSEAGRSATALVDMLTDTTGIMEVTRDKLDSSTMDIGTIVTAIAASGATLALAQGLAGWLRARRDASLTIELVDGAYNLKVEIAKVDPSVVERIVEKIRGDRVSPG